MRLISVSFQMASGMYSDTTFWLDTPPFYSFVKFASVTLKRLISENGVALYMGYARTKVKQKVKQNLFQTRSGSTYHYKIIHIFITNKPLPVNNTNTHVTVNSKAFLFLVYLFNPGFSSKKVCNSVHNRIPMRLFENKIQ